MASAWIYQRPEQVRDLGEAAAPYYVGWVEPDGRRKGKCCGAGFQGKKKAERLRRKLEAELMTGTYQMHTTKLWADFHKEYERRILDGKAAKTKDQAALSAKLAYSEQEAAALLDVKEHVLRDERRRGRIQASVIVGRRVRYSRADLLDYLAARRVNGNGHA